MVATGPIVDVTLVGGTQTGPVTFTVPIDPQGPVVQAVYTEKDGWQVEPGRIDVEADTLRTSVAHLSVRGWFRWDLSWLKEAVEGLLDTRLVSQASTVDPVSCDVEDWPPTDGWAITSDRDERTTWCLRKGGPTGRQLLIQNGRRYPVAVALPASWNGRRPSLPLAVSALGDKLEEAIGGPKGTQVIALRRGDTLTIDLPDGAPVRGPITVSASPLMANVDSLEVAADVFMLMLGKLPGWAKPAKLNSIKDPQTLLSTAGTVKCILGAYNSDQFTRTDQPVADPQLVGRLFRCFKDAITDGKSGLVATVLTLLELPLEVLALLPPLVTGAVDTMRDESDYSILVSRSGASPVPSAPEPAASTALEPSQEPDQGADSNLTAWQVGGAGTYECSVAWPFSPQRSSTSVEFRSTCLGQPTSILFVDITVPDPNYTPPGGSFFQLKGRIVDMVTSDMGFSTLLLQADELPEPTS